MPENPTINRPWWMGSLDEPTLGGLVRSNNVPIQGLIRTASIATVATPSGGSIRKGFLRIPPGTKPHFGETEINWSHPLAIGLVDLWLFNEDGGPAQNMATPANILMQNGTVDRNANVRGSMAHFPGGASNYFGTAISPSDTPYTGAITLVWRGVVNAVSPEFMSKCVSNGPSSNAFDFRTDASASPIPILVRANGAGGFAIWTMSGGSLTTGGLNTVMVTHDGTIQDAATFYINGVSFTSTNSGNGGTGGVGTTGKPILLGARDDGAPALTGFCELATIWSRQLTAAEALLMHSDPYAVLRPLARRRK